MMTSIDNEIDALLARVKSRAEMRDFVFVPAYPPNKTPNPVKKYTVAVENHEIKHGTVFIGGKFRSLSASRLADVELRLRVYAPEHSSGSALLRASAMLYDALEACDRDRMIVSLAMYGIGFDTASRTEYRDVTARLYIKV